MPSGSPCLPTIPMKRTLFFTVATTVISTSAAAQTPWIRQAQLPTWKNTLSITAPADDLFFASAGALFGQTGDILRNDGGAHTDWTVTPLSNSTINAVFFLDTQRGWAAGNGMFHTVDGGQTWVQDNNWGSMYDLFFLDALNGWAAGNGGIVYRTTDGGTTWSGTFAALSGNTAKSVWFIDSLHGWAAGIGGHLSETTDGGATWTQRHAGSYLTTVQFFDALEGWGIGGDACVHTIDGGASWTTVTLPSNSWVHGGRFFDASRGIAVGEAGNIVYTHDGGVTWQTARPSGSGPLLWDVEFSPGGVAVASGNNGYLLRSDDFGMTWTPLQSGASWTTRGMDAIGAARAWAANEAGEIALTTDGGGLWERVTVHGFDQYGDLFDIDFVDANTGWTVGQQQDFGLADLGQIARSTDGGRSWQLQFAQHALEFFGVTALDSNTAIAYGRGNFANSAYLRTTDGGLTWSGAGNPALIGTFRDAFFLPDGSTGWLVSDDIWHTTDGGATWSLQFDGNTSLASISFADANHGWASGFVNTLLRTTDGGQTWTAQDPGGPVGAAYMAVAAGSADEAVVVGWQNFVARTTDGGSTWIQESTPDLPLDEPAVEWNAAVFQDGEYGWIGGNAGIYRRGSSLLGIGTTLCFGDASAASCPCANNVAPGEQAGCQNSTGHGAMLVATGSVDVATDNLTLHVSQARGNVPGIFLQGGSALVAPFKDGLLCAGNPTERLQVAITTALGATSSTGSIVAAGAVSAGQLRYYQYWYRDPGGVSPCGTGSNFTNAVAIGWE